MADNRLIIRANINASISVEDTIDSKAYTQYAADQIVGGSKGGTVETTYADAKVSKYTGVVNNTATTALASTGMTKTGTDPSASAVKAYSVTYDSAFGDPGVVDVYVAAIKHASLSVGEGCVIPFTAGVMANLKIANPGWVTTVDEATCTCIAIGD